jgi:uncharacterized repeat protein (TIGR02543 family)
MDRKRNSLVLRNILSALIFGLAVTAAFSSVFVQHSSTLAATPEPHLWAVMVGVTEYRCPTCIYDQEWNMYPVGIKYPDDNARDLAAQLSPIAGDDHIKLVLNEQATNSGIYYAVKWLAEKAGPDDTALFYFSGHSAPHYFGSYDFLVSDQQMADWLDSIHANRVFVILDTCYAGSFQNELGTNGRAVLMSCQPYESSLEDREFKNGVFTYYILQALKNFDSADTNRNCELSAAEMFNYADSKTADEIVAPFANLPAFSSGNMQHPALYIPPYRSDDFNLLMKVTVHSDADIVDDTTVLTIDGTSYLSKQLPASLTWLSGTSHRLDVPLQVNMVDGTRLVFASWSDGNTSSSRVIGSGGEYTANYKTQYRLSVDSHYGNATGSGWYDSGSNAAISTGTSYGTIIKHTFTGWSGDYTGAEATATITMDKSKTVTANWHSDYLRLYLLVAVIVAVMGGLAAAFMIRRRNTQGDQNQ